MGECKPKRQARKAIKAFRASRPEDQRPDERLQVKNKSVVHRRRILESHGIYVYDLVNEAYSREMQQVEQDQ